MDYIYPEDDKKKEQEAKDKMPKSEEEFEKEFYEPMVISRTTNIIGWTIAIILFLLAIWLLWLALK